MAKVNLQLPLQGRRWLALLREDPVCGFRLAPHLEVPAARLGFSYKTNELGLHGPASRSADRVIFGTSYAQGMAVNEGENWYEHALNPGQWLNLGLPVGINEWAELARQYHQGGHKLALLIYHPNIWAHCQMYERWRASGKGLFSALNWRTGWAECAWLTGRRYWRKRQARKRGETLCLKHQQECYDIDLNYAYVDVVAGQDMIRRNLLLLKKLLEPFQQVLVVRVPIKQELIPPAARTGKVLRITGNYDTLWHQTGEALESLKNIKVEQPDIFKLDHYHPQDTHWNAEGNRVFAHWLKTRLKDIN